MMDHNLPSTYWLTIYKTLRGLMHLDYCLRLLNCQGFSCQLLLPPPLMGQVILKCKSINVSSITCHFRGLALSSISSFGPSPHFFFLAYRPLHSLFGPRRTFYHPIVPICGPIYTCFCVSTWILLSLGNYLNIPKVVFPYYYTNYALIIAFLSLSPEYKFY